MEQNSSDAAARAVAFANGLRKSITASGRRWTQWPGGAKDLAVVLGCVDAVALRLKSVSAEDGAAEVAACIADLRAVLEWATYQSASVATAQALRVARKTRTFAERLGVLDNPAARLSILVDSEESLIENVQTKNDYMRTIAGKHPELGLPQPLVRAESLAPKAEEKPSTLDFIQQMRKNAKKN
jgi:hypothetical protein